MAGGAHRVVVVTRETEYEHLLARHATRDQASFFLKTRDQSIEPVWERHVRFEAALKVVQDATPVDWRANRVGRGDLDRFLFEPSDVVVVVGQDGLVANVSKYLDGQMVLGVNSDPDRNDGVLVPLTPSDLNRLLIPASECQVDVEVRTMVEASLDDGQTLLALNEVFVGHRSHQSARYGLQYRGQRERQSSSGMIAFSGTGATGWARSIARERSVELEMPQPDEDRLAFFVREAFPSVATGTNVSQGHLARDSCLEITSEMDEGGVIFGDGIEADHLEFDWGVTATIRVAEKKLLLVRG